MENVKVLATMGGTGVASLVSMVLDSPMVFDTMIWTAINSGRFELAWHRIVCLFN